MRKDRAFTSERLSYRGITETDAPLIVRWRSDPDNYRFFFSQAPVTLEGHLSWYRHYLGDPTRYDFMVLDENDVPVGTVGLSAICDGACEVNYMIGEPSARGRGYATEAVRAMCGMAFREFGVSRVEARILPGNEASMAVARAAGLSECELVFYVERED